MRDTQQGLRQLAEETGGLAHFDTNGLNASLDRVLSDQAGYYLLGYNHSGDSTAAVHRLALKLKLLGLQVRYRKSFLGQAESDDPGKPLSPSQRLFEALQSPFSGSALYLRLTAVFALGEQGQLLANLLLFLPFEDLAFGPPAADGRRPAQLHILAELQGDASSKPVHVLSRFTVHLPGAVSDSHQEAGFVYAFQQELPKPGAYLLRVAVLDALSGNAGSANQYLEIPNLTKRQLSTSGVTMLEMGVKAELRRPTPIT